jgi:hypothetical protein
MDVLGFEDGMRGQSCVSFDSKRALMEAHRKIRPSPRSSPQRGEEDKQNYL